MPSIVRKVIHGQAYYYAVWSARVNGQPRIVKQKYLGRVEQLIENFQSAAPVNPRKVFIAEFGAVAALFAVAERLGLAELIDTYTPKRRQGLSVGQYITLATINRAVRPLSKNRFEKWYRSTILTRLIPAHKGALSSQRFWDHMSYFEKSTIRTIQEALAKRVLECFGIDLSSLVYDGTNFFTFINTRTRSRLAQRGHNKAKRNDLRQISLGLVVSREYHIPLLFDTYPGNLSDSQEFLRILKDLLPRFRSLCGQAELTLVFDKGNNSEVNFTQIEHSGLHFIGSLVPSQHTDLLEIPLKRFQSLEGQRLQGVRAYRTTKEVFRTERTIVVTYNPRLYQGQKNGLRGHLRKKLKKLKELREKLRRRREGKTRGGHAPSLQSVHDQVEKIREGVPFRDIIIAKVRKTKRGLSLVFRLDRQALQRYCQCLYGKTILFTDNHSWGNEDIVLGYRAQYRIEDAFRDMKDPEAFCWWPQFHWTDQKIEVHAFYCVLALLLTSLLQRELHHRQIDLSIPLMLETLRGIKEVLLIYPGRGETGKGQRRGAVVLSQMDDTQQRIFKALKLERFIAG
jgi:transposase